MKTSIFLLLVVAMAFCSSTVGTIAEHYCGRRLASVIAALCDKELTKRIPDYDYGWPLLAPYQVHQLRGKRDPGIIAECCDKACTTDELMTYC